MQREHDELQAYGESLVGGQLLSFGRHGRQGGGADDVVPLYLAGPSSELERVRRIAGALERTGLFSLTCPWWDGAEDWAGRDSELSFAEQARRSRACFDAIGRSAIFFALFPSYRQRSGVETELGYALATSSRRAVFTIVTGQDAHESILTSLARVRDTQDHLGIAAACRYARELQAERAAIACIP